jgi:hypothetical protein
MKAIEVCIVRQDEVHSQVLETTSRTHIVKTSSHDNLPLEESIQDLVPTWADLQRNHSKLGNNSTLLTMPRLLAIHCSTLKKNMFNPFLKPFLN